MSVNKDAEDIGKSLAYRTQQTAAYDEMKDLEKNPTTPAEKQTSPYAKIKSDKVPNQRPAPKGGEYEEVA